MSDLSWLNPTPHAIAVYASQPLSPVATQHSLPSGRYSLTWAGLPPAGSHQLAAGALIQSPRQHARAASPAHRGRAFVQSAAIKQHHHATTSSTSARKLGGKVNSIAFAVLRLISSCVIC